MDSKLYLTIAAIVAILYGIGFVLIPGTLLPLYGVDPEAHAVLNIQFFGATLIAIGVIFWSAREFREWDAVRGVLIGAVVGDALGLVINVYGIMRGLVNAFGWSSTIVYVLLLLGALYCLFAPANKQA